MQHRVAQAGCNNITFNESHIPVLQQMENMHNHLQTEINEAQSEFNTLSTIAESFFPPVESLGNHRQRRSIDEEAPHNRTRRLIGAVAALTSGTGSILGVPIKDAACNALSIFILCVSTEDLEREIDQVTKQQKTQQQAFQTVQDQNNEKLALLRDEIRLTQESVERIKEDTYSHIWYMLDRIYTLEDAFRCYQFESAYRHFLQSSQLYLSQIGTLYTHFKAFRAAFYAYRNNFFSKISSLATGHITPQFLLPTQLATIAQELAAEEFRKGSKLTPAIPSGFEAIYYELQIVLEVTMLPKGIFFVLGISMNSESATYNVFQAKPLYQPNDDGKTASVYQFPKPYVAIATDNTNFAELAASRLQQCTGSIRINLCRKGFSTTTDETMKRFSVSRRCFLVKTYQHSETAPFLLSFLQKPHRQSTWQMAITISFLAIPQWTSRTTADQMDSVCPPLIVRLVYFDRVEKVSFILIKAILSCHPIWMHVKRLRNHTLQQSNWHPL